MYIKKCKQNVFDVFLGKGWKFWGRFLVNKQRHLIKLKGNQFTQEELEEVEIRLCSH